MIKVVKHIKVRKDFDLTKSPVKAFYSHKKIRMGKLIPPETGVASIAEEVMLDLTGDIILSPEVLIQNRVQIYTHNHGFLASKAKRKTLPTEVRNLFLGEDCFIGAGAIIICIDEIGIGAAVGAGAVITKNIGPYEVWAGNPAKLIGIRGEYNVGS